MSLKTIHVVFVAASLFLTAFFGVWSWRQYTGPEGAPLHLAFAILSIVAFAGL